MDPRDLGPRQLDGLREVANIGAGHAATALSQMINERVLISVPAIKVVQLEEVPELIGAPEQVVSAVMMKLIGDVTGRTVQIFPGATAATMASVLLGQDGIRFPDDFSENEQSALKEVSNILVGAYINALSEFMGMMLIMSPPAIAIDTASAVLTSSYLNIGAEDDYVFCVNTELLMGDRKDLSAHFLLVPDDASLRAMLKALRLS